VIKFRHLLPMVGIWRICVQASGIGSPFDGQTDSRCACGKPGQNPTWQHSPPPVRRRLWPSRQGGVRETRVNLQPLLAKEWRGGALRCAQARTGEAKRLGGEALVQGGVSKLVRVNRTRRGRPGQSGRPPPVDFAHSLANQVAELSMFHIFCWTRGYT
jgi:hypothetical protein